MKKFYFLFLMMLLPLAATAQKEFYGVQSNDGQTWTYYYDTEKEKRGGTADPGNGLIISTDVVTVVFDSSVADYRPTSMTGWFNGCKKLTTITGIEYLNTSEVRMMNMMFMDCSLLTSVDLSYFNTSKVTTMVGMFQKCHSLSRLDLTSFNTSNVTSMEGMFSLCNSLRVVDLSSFNTSKVVNMSGMFAYCEGLKTVYADESRWSTAAVTNGSSMFCYCDALKGGNGTTWEKDGYVEDHSFARVDKPGQKGYFTQKDGPSVTTAEPYAVRSEDNSVLTFYYDDKKKSRGGYDVGPLEYDYSNDMRWGGFVHQITTVIFDASFAGCTSITSTLNWFRNFLNLRKVIGIKYLNTINVKSMRFMFSGCESLTVLDVSHFDTRNVTDMAAMFSVCENLKKLDVSGFDTRNVTDMSNMFSACKSLKTLDVSNFDISNVTDFIAMFNECTSLSAIYCDNSWAKNLVKSDYMFSRCSSLSGYDSDKEFEFNQIQRAKPIANDGYFTPTSEIVRDDTDEAAIAYLCERGVLSSTDINGETQLEDPLKRGYLAKIAFQGLYLTNGGQIPKIAPSDNYPTIYSDLMDKTTDYYRGAHALMYLDYGDDVVSFDRNRLAFEPEEKIARVHVLKVLLEAFNIKPEPDYISKAASLGIIKSSENFRPYDNCTRGESFLMLARIMQKIEVGEIDDPNPMKSDYFEPLNTTQKTISLGASLQMGNFQHYTKTSFALSGVVPLAFAHTYNSYNTTLPSVFFGDKLKTEEDDSYQPLGDGWSHNYHSFITVVGDYQKNSEDNGLRVIVHWGGGSIDIYKSDGTRLVPESIGIYDEMEYAGGDELTIKSKSQIEYLFSKQGSSGAAVFYLSSVKDRNGNTLTINYEDGLNGSARIKSVSDGNRSLDFSYLSGTDLLSEVKDPLSRSIKFDYFDNEQTGKKQLKSFTDAEGNTTTYEYANLANAGSSKLLSRIQLPKGNYVENEYDANRRLKNSVSGVDGVPTTKTSVNVQTNYSSGSISTKSQVDVERGSQTSSYQFTYNENNVVTSMTGGKGLFAKGKYGNSSHPELPTAIQSNSTNVNDITYDEKGNVTSITVSGNGTLTTTMTYDEMNNLTSRTDPMGNKTTFRYDGNGNLTEIFAPEGVTASITVNSKGLPTETSNAMGVRTQYDYNEYGNLIKTTLPALGLSSSAVYDAASRLTSATDALGRTSSFVYSNNDFLTSETDALNHTTKYAYDKNDNLTSITNAKGGVTTMSYDNATDWLLSVEFAGAKKQYDYNKDGTLSTFTKPDGTMLSYSYDELGRITSDGINSYSYDNKLRLSEISDGSKSVSFTYDGFNRITGTSYDGTNNSYSYDENGNCTSVNGTQYSYDGLNRLTSVSFSGGTINYTYRKDSKLDKVEYPNGMTTTFDYDEVGRLTSKQTKLSNGTVVAGYSYILDKVGNITEQTTKEPYSDIVLQDEDISYSYNEGNRITKAGDISFEFDANGNTTKRGDESYSWDEKDHLTSAGSTSITYDPLGLIASYGDITFTTDPLGMGNVLSDSKSGAEYIYGNGLEARVINGKASYYVTDVRGSVVAIVDEDGNITHKYQYDDFGKVVQKEEADYNPFQYVGKYGVMALNDHQYYMRARHYDPTIGRFLSEDPIWSTNLYPYADNNPVMGIDPRGRKKYGYMTAQWFHFDYYGEYDTYTGITQYYKKKDGKQVDESEISQSVKDEIYEVTRAMAEADEYELVPKSNGRLVITKKGTGYDHDVYTGQLYSEKISSAARGILVKKYKEDKGVDNVEIVKGFEYDRFIDFWFIEIDVKVSKNPGASLLGGICSMGNPNCQ